MAMRTRGRSIIIPAAVIFVLVVEGLVSVHIGYPSFDFRNGVLVLLTGWLVGLAGLIAWQLVPTSRVGPLLVVVAMTWYLGGLRWASIEPLAATADVLDLVYAAAATHVVLTYPTGRAGTREVRLVVLLAYVASMVPVPRADTLVAIVLTAGLAGLWLLRPERRWQRRSATLFGLLFALVLGTYHLVPDLLGGLRWLDTRPLLQVTLVMLAFALVVALVRSRDRSGLVVDAVVELMSDPGADLEHSLGDLLGDPDVRVGLWDTVGQHFVDARGRPVAFASDPERALTMIDAHGQPLACVDHRRAATIDEPTRLALTQAAELAAANARLQADVREQVVEVRASRLRLVVAADEERLRLEAELFATLDPELDALEAVLSGPATSDEEAARTAVEQVRRTRDELAALVRGWGPPALDERGVSGALSDIASRAKVPVELQVTDIAIPSRLAASTLVFVASEALANVAKHAEASGVTLRLSRSDGEIRIEIVDDGRGGADARAGTGLQGLRDRVEAIGGRMVVDSRIGQGTRIEAAVPFEGAVS